MLMRLHADGQMPQVRGMTWFEILVAARERPPDGREVLISIRPCGSMAAKKGRVHYWSAVQSIREGAVRSENTLQGTADLLEPSKQQVSNNGWAFQSRSDGPTSV